MSRRSRIWLVVAALFTLINLVGTGMAAVSGEVLHTFVHAVLVLPGAFLVWRLLPRRMYY